MHLGQRKGQQRSDSNGELHVKFRRNHGRQASRITNDLNQEICGNAVQHPVSTVITKAWPKRFTKGCNYIFTPRPFGTAL
eukprot:3204970-Amphidinium_carterae.1